jgi:D-3-phosphoglycerate dehydrogenase
LEQWIYKPQSDYTSTKEEIENKIQEYQGIVIRSRFKIV